MIISNNKNLIFYIFFLIKIFFVISLVPSIQEKWFIDFINNLINNPTLDPWSNYLTYSTNTLGFPYGPVMILIFLPFSILFWIIGMAFNMQEYFLGIGFRLTLLFFDFIGYLVLSNLLVNKKKEIIFFYWLSPLIFFVTYIYGQLDIIPTTILLIAYLYLFKNKFKISGILFGLAIATKLSVGLIMPFPIIYLFQNKRLATGLISFTKYLLIILFLFTITPIISSGYREMVLATPTKGAILWFQIPLDENLKIFILPFTFLLIIYSMWRIKRSNFTLLSSITGLVFLISTLMMPPNPGWYLWALPFLIIYQIKTDINGKLLISFFTLLPILIIFPKDKFSNFSFFNLGFEYNTNLINNLNQNLIYTLFISLGVVIALRLYRETIKNNDYYKLNQKALSIGIIGGPASGKKVLSNAIIDILGNNSSLLINENEYLKWNKNFKKSDKKNLINIKSKNLLKLNTDIDLIINKNVPNRKTINSSIYKKNKSKYLNKDFIIATGYHLFLPKTLNKLFDIKVFLDPEKALNKNWLENKNDNVNNIVENYALVEKYEDLYSQQKNSSDLIFSFSYINKDILSYKTVHNLPLKMDVFLRDGIYAENLSKALISICGVKLNLDISNTNFSSKISIEGDIWPDDIKLAANKLVPNLDEIIDSNPKWHSDTIGLMQLIILMQISYSLKYTKQN